MDVLPFQAAADESSKKKEDYLDVNLDGELIDGVKLETPEKDDDLNVNQPDERPTQVHSTDRTYTASLAFQQGSTVRVCESAKEEEEIQLQAASETSEDTRIVEFAPEIDFEFGDEPIIELSSYY